MHRRKFIAASASVTAGSTLNQRVRAETQLKGKAEHVISIWLGGGLQHCGAYGETDELSKNIVTDPVSVADLFATIDAAVGIDYGKNLYDGDRPVPVTDRGKPIAKLFG